MESPDKQEPIAIIGAACRFAGEASSLGSLWDMMSNVRTGHCKVPEDRWNSENWYHPDPDRKGGIASQHGYFLQQDISVFDAPFFSMTAKEAAIMDPMKRLLLETCYESIENAGVLVEDLMNSKTGCYVGCMTNDYEMTSLHDIYDVGGTAASGLSEAMIANRVSWFFGLKGPSLTLDTACSSSLYALHLACQSLRLGETNMSLVTGVNLMFNPNTYHQLTLMHMLSPEGISHTFDDRANGYGRGDGIGSLIVKRLSDAIRDGDTIRAVIRGTGANADGKTPSITQPSSEAQAELIIQTYEDAGLDPALTGYFECHGTGTPVGDPLELTAIANTMGAARRSAGKEPLLIGSIKPTVGHTEGCAGLAGVFKAILLLEKGLLVPTYGVERVNPKLKFEEWHLALPQKVMEWPTDGLRRASVNSFGFGGANAHVIMDDAYHYLQERGLTGRHNTTVPPSDAQVSTENEIGNGTNGTNGTHTMNGTNSATHDGQPKLLLFSGKEAAAASKRAQTLSSWIDGSHGTGDEDVLDALAYTLAAKRSHLDHRTFAIANSLSVLQEKTSKGLPAPIRSLRNGNNIVMVFTGQGAQWPAMGRELLRNEHFHRSITVSQSYLESFGCKWDAIEELTKTADSNINLPEYSQPLCTVVQVALVDLLRHWQVSPVATIGHSSGEIAAAYGASLITHKDAIKLAYVRGLSSAAVTKHGAMMAAGVSEAEAEGYLKNITEGSAVVACVNSPSSVTLSGDVEAIDELEKLISADGKFARKLKVNTAYHSPHMRDVSESYYNMIGKLEQVNGDNKPSRTVMYSSLTGSMISSAEELDARYWVENMQRPVKFLQGLLALLKHKRLASESARPTATQWGAFVEVGPHAALQGPLRQIIDASGNKHAKEATYVSMLVRGKDAIETSLNAAGALWATGAKVDLSAVNQQSQSEPSSGPRMLCDLPAYPWNHAKGFWHESYASKAYRFPPHVRSDYLGVPEDSQNAHEPQWRNYLRIAENPWIEDHVITGTVLYPGAGMLVMAIEAALCTADANKAVKGFRLTHVRFARGLVVSLDDMAPVATRISLHPHSTNADAWEFTVYSMNKGTSWTKHCSGTITIEYKRDTSAIELAATDALWDRQVKVRKTLTSDAGSFAIDTDAFYENLDKVGMQYGPVFRNVKTLSAVPSQNASFGEVAVPDTKSTMPKHYESSCVVHPATMDSIFHLALATLNGGQPVKQAAVPYGIDEIYVARDQPQEPGAFYSGYGRLLSHDGHEINTELVVSDQDWLEPKLTIKTFALRQVSAAETSDAAGIALEEHKKCAGITWIPDLAYLHSDHDMAHSFAASDAASRLDKFFDSIFLRTSHATALVVMLDASESSLHVLRRLKQRTHKPSQVIAFTTSEGNQDVMQVALGTEDPNMAVTYQWMPESELIASLAAEANDVVIGLGVVADDTSTVKLAALAPTACLVSTTGPTFKIPEGRYNWNFSEDDVSYQLSAAATSPLSGDLPEAAVLLMPPTPSDAMATLAAALEEQLLSIGVTASREAFDANGVATLGGKNVISLLEAENPLVYMWDESEFSTFKALISTVSHLFWISRGGVLQSWSSSVEFATTQGLLRVMRNEYPMLTAPLLDLSTLADTSDAKTVDIVLSTWRSSLADGAEMEYAEQDGMVFVPRATSLSGLDYELQLENNAAKPVIKEIGSLNGPSKAVSSSNGTGAVWVLDEAAVQPLGTSEVEIKVEHMGLKAGQPFISAKHAVGTVVRVGEHVTSVNLGQRVVAYSPCAASTHIRQTADLVSALPEGISAAQAISLIEPLLATHYVLHDAARLQPGQVLLLDNAASPIGQAIIHVAQAHGASIFALVSSEAERDAIIDGVGLEASRIFDAGLQNFVPLIEDATQDRGVDVFISQKPGAHMVGALSSLRDFGTFVDISGNGATLSLQGCKGNMSYARVDISAALQANQKLVSKLFQQAFNAATVPAVLPPAELPVTYFSSEKPFVHAEDVVISIRESHLVNMPAPPPKELSLNGEVAYVLAGGLGALGLDVADWMIDCGAKSLVFMSRSGGKKNREDLERFRARGVDAEAFACDVNDAESVARTFAAVRASGKKIGGVIQMAMVLEDSIFDNMSFTQWRRAIEPKTKGSRNLLANIWPGDDSFFILLSSITGVIGNTAQANYASGNTFEDALAQHARTHLGINATSIDVGLVVNSSHFTTAGEFGDITGYLNRYQHGWKGLQTSLGELGVVMRTIMRGSTTDGHSLPPQVVLGLGTGIEYDEEAGGYTNDKKFELRVVKRGQQDSDGSTKQDIGTLLSNAKTMAEAVAAVEGSIKELVAKAMDVELEQVDGQKPLYDYGVDSLQAADIRSRAQKNMKSDISVFDILSAMPLAEVAAKIASKSQLVKVAAAED